MYVLYLSISLSLSLSLSLSIFLYISLIQSVFIILWLVLWLPFFIFPYFGNLIIPIDFHIFQRGGYTTTNQFLGFWDMIGHRPCSYGKRGYCAMASSPELCYGETSWPPGNQPATRSPRNWGPMNSGDFVFGVPQVFWKHHLAGHIIF